MKNGNIWNITLAYITKIHPSQERNFYVLQEKYFNDRFKKANMVKSICKSSPLQARV
jgi:hypothetical protein